MKSIFFKSLSVAAMLAVISCNNTSSEKRASDNTERSSHEISAETIMLNNGEKWKVNDEMMPFIRKSETILSGYIESNSTDYKNLANQLDESTSGLIKSCTMEGESHNELHKWLHPHMELIESLGKAENPDEAKPIVSELKRSFETFNQYFK